MALTQSVLAGADGHRTEQEEPPAWLASTPCGWEELRSLVSASGSCWQWHSGPTPAVVILGDSHADHLYPGAIDTFPGANVGLVSLRSPRLFGGPDGARRVAEVIGADANVKVVIISRALDRSEGGILPHERIALPALAAELDRVGKQVFVLDDVPSWPSDIFTCHYRHSLVLPGTVCTADRAFFEPRHTMVAAQLAEMLAPLEGVRLLESYWAFCDESTCNRAIDEQFLYSDEDHLSGAGSRLLWRSMLASSPELRAATAELG